MITRDNIHVQRCVLCAVTETVIWLVLPKTFSVQIATEHVALWNALNVTKLELAKVQVCALKCTNVQSATWCSAMNLDQGDIMFVAKVTAETVVNGLQTSMKTKHISVT